MPRNFTRVEAGSPQAKATRSLAFGQAGSLTPVDRFGVWLSARRIRKTVPTFRGKRIGDFGCGYQAAFTRTVLDEVSEAVIADISLADDLKSHPKVTAIEGTLPSTLAQVTTGSLDVILSVSVLEHLWEPLTALREFRRILAPGGICLINVPSWRGKWFLELSAFRLGLSPKEEMDDHKMYYDVRDLWPLLVLAGFLPSGIRCYAHKFGLNTFAVCRKDEPPNQGQVPS
jgi:SAM-dependent methyltransferase